MNAEERATWHMLLDAAQGVDHGPKTRKRLREAALAYADAARRASAVAQDFTPSGVRELRTAKARRGRRVR